MELRLFGNFWIFFLEEDTILSKTSRSPPNIVASVHKEYSDNELASSKSVAEDEVSNTIKHNIDVPESTKGECPTEQ